MMGFGKVAIVLAVLLAVGLTVPYLVAGSPMDARIDYRVELEVTKGAEYRPGYFYYEVALGDVEASAELAGGSVWDRWLRAFYFIDDEGLGGGDEAKQPLYRVGIGLYRPFGRNWVLVDEAAYDYVDNEVRAAGYADCALENSFYIPGVEEGDYQLQVGLWIREPSSDWRSLGGETVTVHL